ncbi:hypothetical protein B0J14DRAFT_660160 [Halenospora varia]|nr:hypothetical protein B0J14DRAFT_660160 [Halenospora varia]
MDPLSIAASVAGLLAAGSKLVAILSLISRFSDVPPLCKAVLTEVCDTTTALRQIQNFLNGQLHVPSERQQHVLLEHLATSLTGCVMTKDELESLLDGMGLVYANGGFTGIFDRVNWVRKEEDIQRLIQRLNNHKMSLNLILTVFQCSSVTQIHDAVNKLAGLFEASVANSSALEIRVRRLERGSTSGDPPSQNLRVNNAEPTDSHEPGDLYRDDASVRTITQVSGDDSQSNGRLVSAPFAFDTELHGSRVYRRLRVLSSDGHPETAVAPSVGEAAVASILSAISLADISNLSQQSLPICVPEIRNSGWYIPAIRILRSSETPATISGISFDVTHLTGQRNTYSIKPTDTVHQLKLMIGYPPPNQILLVYTRPVWKLVKLKDDKSFEDQGITSTYSDARIYVLLPYSTRVPTLIPPGSRVRSRFRVRDVYERRFAGG